jgi:hypothetical protein
LILLTAIPVAMFIARQWQERRAIELFTAMERAPRTRADGDMSSGYFMMEIPAPNPNLAVRIAYEPSPAADELPGEWDLSQRVNIPAASSGVTRFFFPAYSGINTRFIGVEAPQNAVLYRIDRSARLPLTLWLSLTPDWRRQPMWQRLIRPTDTARSSSSRTGS